VRRERGRGFDQQEHAPDGVDRLYVGYAHRHKARSVLRGQLRCPLDGLARLA
jgi:hypothetical protein